MRKMASMPFLPEASGTKDFIVLGSKTGFIMMLAAAALAIAAVIAIILVIKKQK